MFVKICGTTSEEDALLSVAMGADAIGFVFAPSPRQVQAARVADIVKRLPPEILTVGVFRNDSVDHIAEVVLKSDVRAIQLHGSEDPDDIAAVRKRFPTTIIKAFPSSSVELRHADRYGADIVLLDAPSPGSGQIFDWRLAEGIPDGVRLMLAGGLSPENVTEAIEAVNPWGVDVVSGVESSPGHKDARKLRDFIVRAKAAVPPHRRSVAGVDDASISAGPGPYDWKEDQ